MHDGFASVGPEAQALDSTRAAGGFIHVDQHGIHLDVAGGHFKARRLAVEKSAQDGASLSIPMMPLCGPVIPTSV